MTRITVSVKVKTHIYETPFGFDVKETIDGDAKNPEPVSKVELEKRFQKLLKILDQQMGPDWEDPTFQTSLEDH